MNTVLFSARHKFLYTISGSVTTNIFAPSQREKSTLAQKIGGGFSMDMMDMSVLPTSFPKILLLL